MFTELFVATVSIDPEPQSSTVFQKKQEKKTIDIYWLSDDGGLIIYLSITSIFSSIQNIAMHFLMTVCVCLTRSDAAAALPVDSQEALGQV